MNKLLPLIILLTASSLMRADTFINAIGEGADPWIVKHGDQYILCASHGNRGVALWVSDRLTAIGEKHVVFEGPETGPHSARWWAPELHFYQGRWYIYVATSHGETREEIAMNTRMIVLESETSDPLSTYHFKSQVFTGIDINDPDSDRWAIDGTIWEHKGQLYFIWSGWKEFENNQYNYIAKMSNPWTVSSGRVLMAKNDEFLWERVSESADERGLHEGAQILERGDRVFVVYSASGSWQTSYKLAMLELRPGADPMEPGAWIKHPEPVFQSTDETFGVGHASFTKSPDGTEDWIVYHVKRDERPGWRRAVHIQPFTWDENDWPIFGEPVAAGVPLPRPSGESFKTRRGEFVEDFADGWDRWAYYGHHQDIAWDQGKLRLRLPVASVNHYGTGPKVVLKDYDWEDFDLTALLSVVANSRPAGVLFRLTEPALGFNNQKAYFAGIRAGDDSRIILAEFDGSEFTMLAQQALPIQAETKHRIRVVTRGPKIEVFLNGEKMLEAEDHRHRSGTIGLRSQTGTASFHHVHVKPVR